jgi:predicted acyl esterase
VPGQAERMPIEIIPTCNVFKPGHRIRLEIASSDNMRDNPFWYHRTLPILATNSVIEGRQGSKLVLPVIPR